jgi:hypothetical protein
LAGLKKVKNDFEANINEVEGHRMVSSKTK